MKVVILAGGLGSRLSEYTKLIPKPMVKIGKFPIIIHIMNHYLNYGLQINPDVELYEMLIEVYDKMIASGYKLNKNSGDYERTVQITEKNKKRDITITAAKLSGERDIYYTCSPEENKDYMYVGFLSKASDTDMCIPCCFKKNNALSKNKFKKNYHLKCLGKTNSNTEFDKQTVGDKLYILQDTNKMLPGRFGHMYKYLDYYFNNILKKTKIVKNNYLIESSTGYFMKFGSNQDEFPFLNALSACLDIPFQTIKDKIIGAIDNEIYWTYANSGDLKT